MCQHAYPAAEHTQRHSELSTKGSRHKWVLFKLKWNAEDQNWEQQLQHNEIIEQQQQQ